MKIEAPSGRWNDEKLLRAFVASGHEESFTALVQKYLGLALGIAARRTGNRSLAEEIAQNVFTILARKAGRLAGRPSLAGWIHRTTMIECAEAMRREYAHQRKMKKLELWSNSTAAGAEREALPLLDEAIDALPARDREVILLRFFEAKSYGEIAVAAGKSEDACQKRVERALKKLSRILGRRGIIIAGAGLAVMMSGRLAEAVPARLARTISQNALSGASTLSAKVLILKTIKAMAYTKTKATVAAALVATALFLQWNQNHRLTTELARLRNESAAAQKMGTVVTRTHRVKVNKAEASAQGELAANSPQALAAESPADEWERALLEIDPVQRAAHISQLLAKLTPGAAKSVADVFEKVQHTGIHCDDEFRLFLRAWGKLDGATAMDYAIKRGDHLEANPETLAALAGWASADPEKVKAWIAALPDGSPSHDLLFGLLDGWSMVDFRAAAEYAESLPGDSEREKIRELLFQRSLMAGGLPAAQDWVSRIPGDENNRAFKTEAFDDVIRAMLYRDPSAAAQWISQLTGQPYLAGEAVSETAGKLAESSPTEAMNWLHTLGGMGEKQLAKGTGAILDVWTKQDPATAGTWLTQNRNNPQYDEMAQHYVGGIALSDPASALDWARTISDNERRGASILGAVQNYLDNKGDTAASQLLAAGYTQQMIDEANTIRKQQWWQARSELIQAQRLQLDAEEQIVRRSFLKADTSGEGSN